MKIVLTLLPFIISGSLGYGLINALTRRTKPLDKTVHFFLGIGLGLGTSAFITFFSFVLFNQLNRAAVIIAHLAILLAVGTYLNETRPRVKYILPRGPLRFSAKHAGWLLLLLAFIPLWQQAQFYPMGGWDAWQVWNFKAKFLLLGETQWRNMLDPELWRTSPHYQLLLPLINVWGWCFTGEPYPITPALTALLFTFISAGLLWSALREQSPSPWTILAPLLFLTLPFYGQLAVSQYCDVVVGYYVLAGLYCLMKAVEERLPLLNILSGMFLGLLSFTKPEGLVAAALMAVVAGLGFWIKHPKDFRRFILPLGLGICLAGVPTIIFQSLYSPGNQTFINGFLSAEKPVNLQRLQIIGAFLLLELISAKWNGLWVLLMLGMMLGWRANWRWPLGLAFAFLTGYLGIVLFYYLTNTYFAIAWWLQVTLNRILFSILPAMTLAVFSAVFAKGKQHQGGGKA